MILINLLAKKLHTYKNIYNKLMRMPKASLILKVAIWHMKHYLTGASKISNFISKN